MKFASLVLCSFLFLFPARSAELSAIPAFLEGAIVPLVTPYTGSNAEQVDLPALERLVDYLCSTRASSLFVVSGTGQWDRLPVQEKKDVISTSVRAARGRKAVLAGVGSTNNMEDVLEVARFAESAGAAAVVAVTPEFVRRVQPERRIVDQKLLLDYYRSIAGAVRCPVVVYDPESEVEPETMKKLVNECGNVKAMKLREKKDMPKFRRLVEAVHGRAAILSGSEIYGLAAMKEGAMGMIGNGLNLYPNLGDDLVQACRAKNWKQAELLQTKITEANSRMEQLGGGAQGIKKILNDVIGVKMETANRGDSFRAEPAPGAYEEILNYFRCMKLPHYSSEK